MVKLGCPTWISTVAALVVTSITFEVLAPTLVAFAQTGAPETDMIEESDASNFVTELERLQDRIDLLRRRSTYPELPGPKGGRPQLVELESARGELLRLRLLLEEQLLLPESPVRLGPLTREEQVPILPIGSKQVYLNLYLEITTWLILAYNGIQVRPWEHSSEWMESIRIHITPEHLTNIHDFEFNLAALKQPSQNYMMGPFGIPVQRLEARLSNTVRTRLGKAAWSIGIDEDFINQLLIAQIHAEPGTEVGQGRFFTLLQYLAVRQLQENFTQLGRLRSGSAGSSQLPLGVPSELMTKFRREGLPMLTGQDSSVERSENIRSLLVGSGFPFKVGALKSAHFSKKIEAAIAAQGGESRPKIQFFDSEKSQGTFDQLLQEQLARAPFVFGSMDAKRLAKTLQSIVASSVRTFFEERISYLYSKEGDNDTPVRKKLQLIIDDLQTLLEEHAQYVVDQLSFGFFLNWATTILQRREEQLGPDAQTRWTLDLMADSRWVTQDPTQYNPTNTLNVATLLDALSVRYGLNALDGEALSWLRPALDQPTYFKAQAAYVQKFEEELKTQFNLTTEAFSSPLDPKERPGKKSLNPAVVQSRLKRAVALLHKTPIFDQKISAPVAEEITRDFWAGKRKTFSDFIRLGERLGFFYAYAPSTGGKDPALATVLPDTNDQKKYLEEISARLLDKHPILGVRVDKQPLYELLSALTPEDASPSETQLAVARTLVQRALPEIESNIRNTVNDVAKAEDIEDIAKIVSLSLISAALLVNFPRFGGQYKTVQEQLRDPNWAKTVEHKLITPYITYSSYAIGLLFVVGAIAKKASRRLGPWLSPIVDSGNRLLASHGVLIGSTFGIDFVRHTYNFVDTSYETSRHLQLMRTAAERGAARFGRPLAETSEYLAAKTQATEAKVHFWSFIGMMAGGLMLFKMITPRHGNHRGEK